jgi:hypothetical protein
MAQWVIAAEISSNNPAPVLSTELALLSPLPDNYLTAVIKTASFYIYGKNFVKFFICGYSDFFLD